MFEVLEHSGRYYGIRGPIEHSDLHRRGPRNDGEYIELVDVFALPIAAMARPVQAEADRELTGPTPGIADRLVETRAVVEEAIRLYPPIAAISRVALGDDNLNGERVRPGSLIVISPYVLHRHRLLWDRPDTFDPQRFLGSARMEIDRFAYLPFGVGPRKCIGSTFALQEATLVLAMIAKYFSFGLKPGHAVWPTLRVTLRPANGLPMIVRRRSSTGRGTRASRRICVHEAAASSDHASGCTRGAS
jgi:hypothetical protein